MSEQTSRRRVIYSMAAAMVMPGLSLAQSYPNRPVRLVVPFPAGTGTDVTARLFAQQLQAVFGQTFVVDNKPGAGGSIGAMEVVRAAPDGHTLLFSSNSAAASNVALLKSIPYDPVRDLTMISGIGEGALALMVRADHPARSLEDFIDLARRQPGKLNGGYGSSSAQISLALLNKLARIETTLVPYKGIPLAVNDLISGLLDFSFVDTNNALAQTRGGRLRALAVTSPKRSPLAPDWPALSEKLPGYDVTAWFGLLGPARMPGDLVDRLYTSLQKILEAPELVAKLASSGISPLALPRSQLSSFIANEVEKWQRLAREAGISPE